jgi:long-chain fatty acid transport protein
LIAAVATGASLWSTEAEASGISSARFGGEHGHPTTDNTTAIYYNPAGLALSKGTHIFVDGSIALRWAAYDRPAAGPNDVVAGATPVQSSQQTLQLAPGANDGKATLFNAIAAPFFGVHSDFGTDFMAGGISLSFPFGGAAVWDENPQYQGDSLYPGARDGVQRWYSIDGTIRSMYITGALAFNIKQIGLSIGLSGSAIRSEVSTIRARNPDGTDDVVTTNSAGDLIIKEGRSQIDVNGWQGGFGVGLIYDVLKLGKYFIGVSYTSQPNVAGGMRLKGTLNNAFGLGEPSQTDVALTQTLPDIIRLGIRIKPNEKWEFRAFADYTRWSVFDKQCVVDQSFKDDCKFAGEDNALDDPENFGSADDFNGDPAQLSQHLPRYWKDTGGVRVGGSYWFIPEVEGYLGAGYDGTAVPLETLDPALIDMHKMSLSAGVRWQIIKYFALAFTATELIYFKTSTKGKSALGKFQSPTKQPSGDGVYSQFIQLFNIYADISF